MSGFFLNSLFPFENSMQAAHGALRFQPQIVGSLYLCSVIEAIAAVLCFALGNHIKIIVNAVYILFYDINNSEFK